MLVIIDITAYRHMMDFIGVREIRRHSKVPIIFLILSGSSYGYDYGNANGGR